MALPKKCLSIDVGMQNIKVAEITRVKQKVKVHAFAMLPTPAQSVSDGFILNPEAVAKTISQIVVEHRMKTKEVVFTISSSKIITREVDFPVLPAKKLANIIQMNASEYFPVNLDDYILEHDVLETLEVEGVKTMRVRVLAALGKLVEDYVEVAKRCRLKAVGMDYTGVSLAQFATHYTKKPGIYMYLDLGYASTMVTIIDHGVVKFNRSYASGSRMLIEIIMKHFEVDVEEAVRISSERSFLEQDQATNPYLTNDLNVAVNGLLTGIGRLVDYYTSRNQGGINQIILVGGGARIPGMHQRFSDFFKVSALSGDDLSLLVLKAPSDLDGKAVFLANVIGAVFSKGTMVPKSVKQQGELQNQRRSLVILIVVLLLPFFLITLLKLEAIRTLEDDKARIQQAIVDVEDVLELKNAYEIIAGQVAFRQGILDQSMRTTDVFLDVLALLESTMPQEVFYLTLVNTETGLAMTGVAQDKMTVAALIVQLKAAGFESVFVPGMEDGTIDDPEAGFVTFNLVADYGGEADER